MNRHAIELTMAYSHHHLAMSSPLTKLLSPPFERTSQNPSSPIFSFENKDHPTHSSLLFPFFHYVHHQSFENKGHTSLPANTKNFKASINKVPQKFILELLGRRKTIFFSLFCLLIHFCVLLNENHFCIMKANHYCCTCECEACTTFEHPSKLKYVKPNPSFFFFFIMVLIHY